MLRVIFSNRYEVLREQLLATLEATRGSPFHQAQVIVPSAAVRRSLELSIADRFGICANVQFGFLAEWLWQHMARNMPEVAHESPFASDVLVWRIYQILGDRQFVQAYPRLQRYCLAADPRMILDLARTLSPLIEQYITYRSDWVEAWRQGTLPSINNAPALTDRSAAQDHDWQAALCARILAEAGITGEHPMNRFFRTIKPARPGAMIETVQAFCLPAIAPLYLRMLQGLSSSTDIVLYVINPCEEFWFDIVSARRLSYLAAREKLDHHITGHRLLASWGQQTQSYIDSIVEQSDQGPSNGGVDDQALFVDDRPEHLLGRLQHSILHLQDLAPGTLRHQPTDRSIEVNVCHSLTRELEVLQDRLLNLLAEPDAPALGDIVVLTPDIDAAAPLIDSVFGTAPAARRIPYALAGLRVSVANPVARALLDLLHLVGSRYLASEVYQWMQMPLVARRFGWSPTDLEQLREWINQAAIRWGVDGAHRAREGMPADARFTFRDGLDRLLLGYALPDGLPVPFQGLLASGPITGSDANLLGTLIAFIEQLDGLRARFDQPLSASDWHAALLDCLNQFIDPGTDALDELHAVQHVLMALHTEMVRGGLSQGLPLIVVAQALAERLDAQAQGSVAGATLTFASIGSLRGLPFRCIALIGMNDGSFPANSQAGELDLMASSPRRGDRQARRDDRNLFLDIVLSARDRLLISYSGLGVRDNQPRPASVLVSELIDYLAAATASDAHSADSRRMARDQLVIEHPLQPFSLEYFQPGADPRLRSHREDYCAALVQSGLARQLKQAQSGQSGAVAISTQALDEALAWTFEDPSDEEDDADADADADAAAAAAAIEALAPPFFDQALADDPALLDQVSNDRLIRFFRHPARHLLRHRLQIDLWQIDEALADDEPLSADHSSKRRLARRLMPHLLAEIPARSLHALARAGTEYPSGPLGDRLLTRDLPEFESFAASVRAELTGSLQPAQTWTLELTLPDQTCPLTVQFEQVFSNGLVLHYFGTQRADELVAAWLNHLCLSAIAAPAIAARTVLRFTDACVRFSPLPGGRTEALAHLSELAELYRQGMRAPLPFYPRAALAYMQKGLPEAYRAWNANTFGRGLPGESEDASITLALRGEPNPLGSHFQHIARTVFKPLLANTTGLTTQAPQS